MNNIFLKAILCVTSCAMTIMVSAEESIRAIKVEKKYLNFPISDKAPAWKMDYRDQDGNMLTGVLSVRIAPGEAEYWTFYDVSKWKGRTVYLDTDIPDSLLARIVQSDNIVGEEDIYNEPLRPKYHFTTRRGWINDPNGLTWYNGRYHLFYQHNPYGRKWGNMHWGHAVSTDMMHWKELPLAMCIDSLGMMYSGCALMDYDNVAGFNGPDGEPALIAFYTAHGKVEAQCIAYSLDEGLTMTKYEGNPILYSGTASERRHARDPYVFRYGTEGPWVMILYEEDGNTIYNSDDLVHWTAKSHIAGFYECPGFFELPETDAPQRKHWIMFGASGDYMIGSFDGAVFTPETPKLGNCSGSGYAAQVFSGMPDGDDRVVKMSWGRLSFEGTPFRGAMLLPQEQLLVNTDKGLRLASKPVAEVGKVFRKAAGACHATLPGANRRLGKFAGNGVLKISARVKVSSLKDFKLSYRGQDLVFYDMMPDWVKEDLYPESGGGRKYHDIEVYTDRCMFEVFLDGGLFSYSGLLKGQDDSGYVFSGDSAEFRKLRISVLKDR